MSTCADAFALELVGVDRTYPLHARGSRLEWGIRQVFGVAFGSGYGVRLVVFRGVGRVSWIGFWVEVGSGH
jgi:hypothetical protein